MVRLMEIRPALFKSIAAISNPKKDSQADVVTKTGRKYSYKYATLDQVIGIIKSALEANGLMFMQHVCEKDGEYVLQLDVFNDTEVDTLDWRPYKVLPMPQEQGSWETYMRRYQLMMVFGMAGEDDDGQGAQVGAAVDHALAEEKPARDVMEFSVAIKRLHELTGVSQKALIDTYIERYGNPRYMDDSTYRATVVSLKQEIDKEEAKHGEIDPD